MKKIIYLVLFVMLAGCTTLPIEKRLNAIDYFPESVTGFVVINPSTAVEFLSDQAFATMGIDQSLQKMFVSRTEQIYFGISDQQGPENLNVVITGRFSASLIATGFISMRDWNKSDRKNKIWYNAALGISICSPAQGILVIASGTADKLHAGMTDGSRLSLKLADIYTARQVTGLLQSDLGIVLDLSENSSSQIQGMQINMIRTVDIYSLKFLFVIEDDFIRKQTDSIVRSNIRRSCRPAKINGSIALRSMASEIVDSYLSISGIDIPNDKIMDFFNNFSRYLSNLLGSDSFSLSFDSFM
ncbi:MAG: hypothetical protein JXR63_05600 [Spirochaetales bacterium]|nr:hypothetical protein [Spirochaetales bacterium]